MRWGDDDDASTETGEGGDAVHVFPVVDRDGYPASLRELVATLASEDGLRLFHAAYRENMTHKIERYTHLAEREEANAADALRVARRRVAQLKEAAHVDDDRDNWAVFDGVSQGYRDATERAALFAVLRERARERLTAASQPSHALRDALVEALDNLSNFSSQAHVVRKTADVVASFLKNPRLFRTKLMNFMLMGGAGSGKTTLAEAIGDVFAKAGLFVGNRLVEAGRAELVAQYEGQTVARTRSFLLSHLDAGVVFVDEAYAITPWHAGRPEGYGAEAAAAMVDFMTRYQGLYCLIVAGYERAMTRYFLTANEGLSRRFPHKFVLRDASAGDLLRVFQRALLHAQGLEAPHGRTARLASEDYFTADAWAYLRAMVHVCTRGEVRYCAEEDADTRLTYERVRVFVPAWDKLYRLFEHQAGSMTLLADEAVTVLMTKLPFFSCRRTLRGASPSPSLTTFPAQDRTVMRDILAQRILNEARSEADAFFVQLEQVEGVVRKRMGGGNGRRRRGSRRGGGR